MCQAKVFLHLVKLSPGKKKIRAYLIPEVDVKSIASSKSCALNIRDRVQVDNAMPTVFSAKDSRKKLEKRKKLGLSS